MRPGTDKLLAKAERAGQIAAAALAAGAPEVAGGRAFYAILYAAKALLNERGLRLRTHARIAAALAAMGPAGEPLHAWLAAAMARRRGDESGELTYDEAAALLEHARGALTAARIRIERS
jgi:uncharacterized protein (UPF0332 family)